MKKYIAELDKKNQVKRVLVLEAEDAEAFGAELFGGIWKETSPTGEFRKNFASVGFIYDEYRDAFIKPKPYNSWILNEDTCVYEAPTPYPNDEKNYFWDEKNLEWVTDLSD